MLSCTLAGLQPGCGGTVTQLGHGCRIRRRLQELGMVNGTEIRCLFRGRGGDPTAYMLRGAVIAIRREDASEICVLPF